MSPEIEKGRVEPESVRLPVPLTRSMRRPGFSSSGFSPLSDDETDAAPQRKAI